MHRSVAIAAPEFINITTINPLISKCEIKVCYVGNEPNRNRTVLTKEVATELAGTLPGSPIVGHFNKNMGDFEEHNKTLEIDKNRISVKDDTVPYGFIPTDARVWFQKFEDDGIEEREYLVAEGYLWTGQFPEAQRVIDKGNNQSMELDNDSVKGNWTRSGNGKMEFFIINEAVISKLCILGEDFEPCFEGSQIKRLEFSLDDNFKNTMFSMIEEFKQIIKEGGLSQMPEENVGIEQPVDVVETPVVETPVVEEPVIETSGEFKKEEEKTVDNEGKDTTDKTDDTKEAVEEEEEKKNKYSLDEVVEYQTLKTDFDKLTIDYAALKEEFDNMSVEFSRLQGFENDVVDTKKDEMIGSFYMLSDEDKKDVIDNKSKYSLEEIESKLSVICVRNKVNFNLDTTPESVEEKKDVTTYSLDNAVEDSTPAWVKAVVKVQEKQK